MMKKYLALCIQRNTEGRGESKVIEFDLGDGESLIAKLDAIEAQNSHKFYVWEPVEISSLAKMAKDIFDAGRRNRARDNGEWHTENS
jgi:hypothetical protein